MDLWVLYTFWALGWYYRLLIFLEENGVWTAHRVELAIWAHYVAHDLDPSLLSNMPDTDSSPHVSSPS